MQIFQADLETLISTIRLAWINWDNLGVGPSRRGILSNLQLTSAAPLPMGAAGDPTAAMMGMPMQGLDHLRSHF